MRSTEDRLFTKQRTKFAFFDKLPQTPGKLLKLSKTKIWKSKIKLCHFSNKVLFCSLGSTSGWVQPDLRDKSQSQVKVMTLTLFPIKTSQSH